MECRLCLCLYCKMCHTHTHTHTQQAELLKAKTCSPSFRFTADVRSVLSRNLHQHRLWWLAAVRGRGCEMTEQPPSSRPPTGFHPALCSPSQTSARPSLSPFALRKQGMGENSASHGWTVWDPHSPQTTEEGGGEPSSFFSFIFFFFFFPPLPLSQNNNNGAFLPYQLLILTACVWQWAYVCESECPADPISPF